MSKDDGSYRSEIYSHEHYVDRPGLEKQKKPDGEVIQEHMQQNGVPGPTAKRPLTDSELLEAGIVVEEIHHLPRPTLMGVVDDKTIAAERKVQSDISRIAEQSDDELEQLRRSGLFNDAAYRDILRRRKKDIRTEGAFRRIAQGDDSREEKPGTKKALRDAVGQRAMQFGYRVEMTPAGLYHLIRQATREKIGTPTTLEEIARYLITTHGK
jgi:hypothetical protein